MRRFAPFTILAALTLGAAFSARAQGDNGPMGAPPKFEVKRIPSEPHPGPPPIPEEEIIKRFTTNEDVMKKEYDLYNFTEAIRIQELSDPGGKFAVTGEVYTKPNGERYLRVTKPPESDLKVTDFTLEDVRTIAQLPLFILTTDQISNYTLKYYGQEKLDELNTYIFRVKPKQLSRKYRFFDGVVWVDDQDFAIVKSYGQFVSEIAGNGTKFPFTMFETYRENFQNKYWLPTYTRSDDVVSEEKDSELHLRLVIRDTNFKLNSSPAATPSPAPTAPAATPMLSQPKNN
jgi:hypothetical protein